MKNSAIQWTDHTFNPWIGCTKVAPECKNCYAETLMDKRWGKVRWGKGKPRQRTSAANWRQPFKWNKEAGEAGIQSKVFCASLSDWLDEEVPVEWLADLLDVVYTNFHLDWQLLTKRPQNFRDRVAQCINSTPYLKRVWLEKWLEGEPPPNVWIGVSAGADQKVALEIPAKIRFLSCEPMLHALDETYATGFDWIIFGGESGKNARICWTDWIREGISFCQKKEIAAFVKQLGSNAAGGEMEKWVARIRDSHGGDMSEWPEELRVREFPA